MYLRITTLLCAFAFSSEAIDLVSLDSNWQYRKGTAEASSPDNTAWRVPGFDASSWLTGREAFYYENDTGSSTAYTGNTVLSDMDGNYSCIFMRQVFVVTNVNDFQGLQVVGLSDDGFVAWINGTEVGRFNMPSGDVSYNSTSSAALSEPVPWYTNTITDFQSFLKTGTNVFAVQAFNCNLGSSSDFTINAALYAITDTEAPTLTLLTPTNSDIVTKLVSVEVGFSEPVAGVDASDLLINGVSATSVTALSSSQYLFSFPQPANGIVQFSWAANNGIHDLSSAANAFVGGSWSVKLDPTADSQNVYISEFLTSNSGKQSNSLSDELGDHPDWIEIYNPKSTAASLTGWYLTDSKSTPTKWKFPATVISGRSYLVVFASGRDTNVSGRLHTNFKLSSSSGYLGLYDASTNVVSEFTPYPKQYTDVSYGRDLLDPTITGYYTNATPGAANSTQGSGFGPDVNYSRMGGTFLDNFDLALSTTDTNFEIHYVLIKGNVSSGSMAATNIPTINSTLYTGPITITNAVEVRARTFPKTAGCFPGQPRTECYLKLTTAASTFTSDLPIILIHSLGGGTIPTSVDQSVVIMTFEPVKGVASMTNPPTLVSRAGINIRGRSSASNPQYNLAMETWDEYNIDKKVPFLGMPEESDWVFYAQDTYDTSFLHNPLIHQLSRDVGRYSPRTRFAEVFLNTAGSTVSFYSPAGGNYFGLYTIEEKIKRGNNRVDVTKLEPEITTAPDITGGYMLKIDQADDDEVAFWDSYCQNTIVFVDPSGEEMATSARSAQYNYITGYFNSFGAALWGSSYTNATTGYAAYIDVESWLDHHILNVLAYNVDALRLSGYFFKDRNKKIEMGPLWDFDRSMGSGDGRCYNPRLWRIQGQGYNDEGTDYFGNPSLLGVRWWQRLFTDPDFWQKWIDRWTVLRQDQLSTNHIYAVIDGLTNQLTQAQPREVARWNSNGNGVAPRSGNTTIFGYTFAFNGTYKGEIAFLKKWFADRVNFIDTNFLYPPVFSMSEGPVISGATLTVTAPTIESNTTIYYTLDGTDPRTAGGGVSSKAFSNSSPLTLTITNNIRIFARNWNASHKNMTGGNPGGNPPISSSWSGPTVATYVAKTPTLAVTELMYAPSPSGTNDAEDFEYIELKNFGNASINLTGIHFTNGIDFTFSASNCNTNLPAGAYIIVASNPTMLKDRYIGLNNVAGPYTGHFDNGGERITLLGALNEPIFDFKYDNSWYPTTSGYGFSLVPRIETAATNTLSSSSTWRASTQLGGSPGSADPTPNSIPAILINEALSHPSSSGVDYVELYNPGTTAADISGWFLTDDNGTPEKYVIPAGTTIAAGGYVLFTEKDFGFGLSSKGDQIYLFSGDGSYLTGYRHGFKFGAQAQNVSFGRYVTSDGNEQFVAQNAPTPGIANKGPHVGPVVINEIMYAPPAMGLNADNMDEYIELRNITSDTVLLYDSEHLTNSWSLTGGVDYTFPSDTTIPPWGYLVLVHFDPSQDPVMVNWFRAYYQIDTNTPLYGPFDGNLSNDSDTLSLYKPGTPENDGDVPQILVEKVEYSSSAPWPDQANGTGKTLQRLSSGTFGNDPANWQAALPTPGSLNAGADTYSTAGDGLPDEWKLAYGLDPASKDGDNGPDGDPDGDGMSNLQEYIAGTNPMDGNDYLKFTAHALNGKTFELSFQTHASRTYTIEKTTTLAGPWTSLYTTNATATAACSYQDPVSSDTQFYRIKVTKN